MSTFLPPSSVVRKIWGTPDMVLFIFAGASAEFALNKEVDWLFYTGKLPADPIGRLFSTLRYSQQIIFSDKQGAGASIGSINAIHQGVQASRGGTISQEAYQSVLFMLIHYSIAVYELLEVPLHEKEKDEVVDVFRNIGMRMGIHGLPWTFAQWSEAYQSLLQSSLQYSPYTNALFRQYRKHLGPLRYYFLGVVQQQLVTHRVGTLLQMRKPFTLSPLLVLYRMIRKTMLGDWVLFTLVPSTYRQQLRLLKQ
jgi:uncharacterized protein (DUF2236 family)